MTAEGDGHRQLRELRESVRLRWELAGRLLEKATRLRREHAIKGMQRVERKIIAERTFLESLLTGTTELKEQHLSSSNLLHLEAILHVCEQATGVSAVEQTLTYAPSAGGNPQSVLVDVVASEGCCWIRVFARKRAALHRQWLGDGDFGGKTVTELARAFVEASQQNLVLFQPPQVTFAFFDGITESIAAELGALGVQIMGPVFVDESQEQAPSPLGVAVMFRAGAEAGSATPLMPEIWALPQTETINCGKINLDVSTMLAWVSALTHGGAIHHFKDPIIEEQAQMERSDPLLPRLEAVTEGKKLMACRTAVESFDGIVRIVGGPGEQERARELLARVEVVEDVPSSRAMGLELSGKIKERAKIIFGTGDSLKAVTVTANEAFVRAATHQGVNFDVHVHPSRALTEAKQPE